MNWYNKKLKAASMPRAKAIVRAKNAGKGWAQIAEEFGISRQRVMFLYKKVTAYRNVE